MRLTQQCRYAVDVFAARLEDRQIHYGLVFVLPDAVDTADVRKCSDTNTRSRHGTLADWYLGAMPGPLPSQHAVLLIPRTWLIQQGYLPWWLLFAPYRFFSIRRAHALQEHFWLEWHGDGSIDISAEALKAA